MERGHLDREYPGKRLEAALLSLGMTLYWPFFIHPLLTPRLLPGLAASWTPHYYALVFAAMAVCLLLVATLGHGGRSGTTSRALSAGLGVTSLLVVAILVILLVPGPAASSQGLVQVLAVAAPLVLGAEVTLVTLGWARVAETLPPVWLAMALGASLVCSQLVNAGALSVGAALGIPDPAWTFVFALLSGAVWFFAAARGRLAGAADEGDASGSGSLSWLLMVGVLAVYLFASGVFRSSYTALTGEAEPIFDLTQRIVVLLVSLAVLAYASRSLTRPGREPYPWVVFAFACLAILYLLLIGRQWFPEACNVIVLHSRLIAVFLMWTAAERFARGRHRAPLVLTALFLPLQTAMRWDTAMMDESFWRASWSGTFLEVVLLVTAFAMTVGVFLWVRLRTSEAVGPAAGNAAGSLTSKSSGKTAGCEVMPGIDGGGAPANGAALFAEVARERYGLTDRETDVLRLLARGYAQKSIAEELSVSFNSVRTYVKALYLKLGVHSRQEVIDLMSGRPTE